MFEAMTSVMNFHSDALVLRAERQRILSSNIANADTPGYVARDFDFAASLKAAQQPVSASQQAMQAASVSHAAHIPLPAAKTGHSQAQPLGYSTAAQPSLDNNTVDLDRERANFVDNAVHYEATLRFLNGQSKTMLSAITGQ